MKKIDLIIDLQYGSTGKGLLAGWLAHYNQPDTIMTAWAPNAGHSYIDYDGRKYVHTMLANGIIGPRVRRVMMGPGSILNLDKLMEEIKDCIDVLVKKNISIFIHGNAAVVTPENIEAEQGSMTAIGSTKKGVGAAAISKIQRQPHIPAVARDFKNHPMFDLDFVALIEDPSEWVAIFDLADKILIEGAQGFGLSIQHGFYPYTTSRDVTPMQILADCGVPFGAGCNTKVWGTARTYPIRVANRFDAYGNQIGYSGPCYGDQDELDWEKDLGMQPELTTVTKLPRRIFTYSHAQMQFAAAMCAPHTVFLNFVNYLKDFDEFKRIVESIRSCGAEVIFGVGPSVTNVHRLVQRDHELEMSWDILQEIIKEKASV